MTFWNNLRFAARQLHKNPGFALTVILTLALCIGVNAAIFSVVDSVFFRPLPYPHPDRLIMVAEKQSRGSASGTDTGQTGREWELIRDHATFINPAAISRGTNGVNLAAGGQAEFVRQQRVSAGFFHVLGVLPFAGQEFNPRDDVAGGPDVTILSYAVWRRVFRGDAAIIGRKINLHGVPYTVVGVAPAAFHTDAPVDLWTPLRASRSGEGVGYNYRIIGRLKPDVTLAQATGQLTSVTKSAFNQTKSDTNLRIEEVAVPLQQGLGSELRPKVKLMWAAVLLVLLIGCINIAGILLSRSAVRSREIATRLAIGAARGSVIWQLLTESGLLAMSGCVLGLLIGQFVLRGLLVLNPREFSSLSTLHLDLRVAAFMVLISLATSLVFGLFPAWDATAVDLRSALAEGGRGSSAGGRKWRRQALVFTEIALGVVLVTASGLLVRTFSKLANQRPGFNANHVIAASLSLNAQYASQDAATRLFKTALNRMQEIPGVESAAVALSLPYERPLNMEVQAVTGDDLSHMDPITNMTYVTPGFFQVLQIPLLRGRFLASSDTASAAKVAVINQAFIQKYFRGSQPPLGSAVKIGDTAFQVVGVVGDVPEQNGWGSDMGPLDKFAEVYVTAEQFPASFFTLVNTWSSPDWVVRAHGTIAGLPAAMRSALQSVDPTLPFSSFRSIQEIRGASLSEQRYQAILFSSLAALALLLAALGVYGLVAQSVMQRTREMGIRLALGATAKQVVRLAAVPGIALGFAGVAAGLIVALFTTRLLKSMIWGVSTADPVTLLAVAALLVVIAGLASLIPALRLTRLDPAQTLRNE